MKTRYQFTCPKTGARVRLIERKSFVPPTPFAPASERRAFAVTLSVPGEYATFESFYDLEYAASAFANTCEHFGGVTGANQMVFLP